MRKKPSASTALSRSFSLAAILLPALACSPAARADDPPAKSTTVVKTPASPVIRADDPHAKKRAPIYDEKVDGDTQVTSALARAKKENKCVLLQFGANWCVWCHRLHDLFASDKEIAAKLASDYVVVLVDVFETNNQDHNKQVIERYHATKFGLPVIVILDADGKQLTTQDTGKLEEGDHHSPKKVMDFLDQWAPGKSK